VRTDPAGANIRLLNSPTPYQPGVRLAPGNYEIEVAWEGYVMRKVPVRIVDSEVTVPVTLEKQSLPQAGQNYTEPTTGMGFIWIQPGCFTMGSPETEKGRYANEVQHQVCLKGFWMGRTEVTNAQYRRFNPSHDSGAYESYKLSEPDQPVGRIGWQEAVAYGDWLSGKTGLRFRLPTEAEWEYAARAGNTGSSPWGDEPNQACRYANIYDETARKPNRFPGPTILARMARAWLLRSANTRRTSSACTTCWATSPNGPAPNTIAPTRRRKPMRGPECGVRRPAGVARWFVVRLSRLDTVRLPGSNVPGNKKFDYGFRVVLEP